MSTMTIQDWIRHVDRLREKDDLLAQGYWHGYTAGRAIESGSAPMRGEYYLVRWARPTVAVSHDDRDEVVRLARLIEEAIA